MFFLIFLRIGAMLITMPVFESRSIPLFFKLVLAFATSIILFHLVKLQPAPMSANLFSFSIGVIGEILLGVGIGFSVKLIFAGIQLAGQLAGYQMGLAIANVMDPQDNEQIPLLAQFNNLLALLVFITINAHHWFVRALMESYRLIPPLNMHLGNSAIELIVQLAGNMFIIAIQVGAPVIAALLLTSVAFGLVARTVPQMNVFIVAIPLKIGVGLLFWGFSLPYFLAYFKKIFNDVGQIIFSLLKAMS